MQSRRGVLLGIAGSPLMLLSRPGFSEPMTDEQLLIPMDSLSVSDLTKEHPFGSHPAALAEIDRATNIRSTTPTGPRPIDVAQSFVDRFSVSDPHAISQWSIKESWNPLIASFFNATTHPTAKDTVAWCAAFMNWCLSRAGRPSTKSAASQSFLTTALFKTTHSPVNGDIVVFTCYEKGTTSSLGIGHVTFFKEWVDGGKLLAVGGNQGGVKPSIISEIRYPVAFESSRHINGQRVPVDYKVSRYLHVI